MSRYEYVWSPRRQSFKVKDKKLFRCPIYVQRLDRRRFEAFTFTGVHEVVAAEGINPNTSVDKLIEKCGCRVK